MVCEFLVHYEVFSWSHYQMAYFTSDKHMCRPGYANVRLTNISILFSSSEFKILSFNLIIYSPKINVRKTNIKYTSKFESVNIITN